MTFRETNALQAQAACRTAPPHLFDAIDLPAARPGLEYCARCTVIALCRNVIDPARTRYDGIAAATVWRAGRRIAGVATP